MLDHASIYRMVTPKHLCPWGVKAMDLLRRNGFEIEDHHLVSEEENERYKRENRLGETPQIFIPGKFAGGYDAFRKYLGKEPDPKEGNTYQPVIAVFSISLLMSLGLCWAQRRAFYAEPVIELFVALSMCVLGILKLRDLQSFATGFVQYDLLAQRYVPYSFLYAWVETAGGILMISQAPAWMFAPIVLVASSIGAVSVVKAVYLEKRDLNCACVGGGSKVPLGFISLLENLMMMGMSSWMLAR